MVVCTGFWIEMDFTDGMKSISTTNIVYNDVGHDLGSGSMDFHDHVAPSLQRLLGPKFWLSVANCSYRLVMIWPKVDNFSEEKCLYP